MTTNSKDQRLTQTNNDVIMEDEEYVHETSFKAATASLVCGLYTLCIVVLGIVLPISAGLESTGADLDAQYVQVFNFYIYTASLAFLGYLHVFVFRAKKSPNSGPGNRSTTLAGFFKMAARKKTDVSANNKINEQAQSNTKNGEDGSEHHRNDSLVFEICEVGNGEDVEESPATSPPPISYRAEGVNFYLRLGAIGFGMGNMIYDGLEITGILESRDTDMRCHSPMFIIVAITHMMFTFAQTFFIFKRHRVSFHVHKPLIRLGLMHLLASNISIWASAAVKEATEGLLSDVHDDIPNPSTNTTHLNVAGVSSHHLQTHSHVAEVHCAEEVLSSRAAPYLYPCIIEYSLIAVAVVYKIYQNVGHIHRSDKPSEEEAASSDDPQVMGDCHKSNKGLFFGLFLIVLTLIFVSAFFLFGNDFNDPRTSFHIFYGTEIALKFIACVVVIVSFQKFLQLKFIYQSGNYFDMNLLVVSLFGTYTFYTFVLVSSISSLAQGNNNNGPSDAGLSVLSLGTAILSLIQSGLQTIFILDSMRRSAAHNAHVTGKPGRSLLTFLLICNLSLWIANTFEIEKASKVAIHNHFYGVIAWSIIRHACVPMIIFFRFHSTVCLSDVWMNAYTFKGKGS